MPEATADIVVTGRSTRRLTYTPTSVPASVVPVEPMSSETISVLNVCWRPSIGMISTYSAPTAVKGTPTIRRG